MHGEADGARFLLGEVTVQHAVHVRLVVHLHARVRRRPYTVFTMNGPNEWTNGPNEWTNGPNEWTL